MTGGCWRRSTPALSLRGHNSEPCSVGLSSPMREHTILCISYIGLHNKWPPDLVAYSNRCLFCHCFCGARFQVWFSWVNLAQVLLQGCSQGVGQGCSHPQLDWSWRICFQAYSHGCGQEALVAHWLSLPVGQLECLLTWLLDSPRMSVLKGTKTKMEAGGPFLN